MGLSLPYALRALPSLACAVLCILAGCAVDNRTGAALAQALIDGPLRSYAADQATQVAQASIALEQATLPTAGMAIDLPAAQRSWGRARLAYDRGAALFLIVAPDLDQTIDGRFDNPLATTGLRLMEPALFGRPPADAAVLTRFGATLARDAAALPAAVQDTARAVPVASFIGSMAALAAVVATKLDGSDSPYAGQSHLSMQHNLLGLQTMYASLAPLVATADPALDARIRDQLTVLLALLRDQPSVDAITDKVDLLRRCGDLSQAFLTIGTALGLSVVAPVDVT